MLTTLNNPNVALIFTGSVLYNPLNLNNMRNLFLLAIMLTGSFVFANNVKNEENKTPKSEQTDKKSYFKITSDVNYLSFECIVVISEYYKNGVLKATYQYSYFVDTIEQCNAIADMQSSLHYNGLLP